MALFKSKKTKEEQAVATDNSVAQANPTVDSSLDDVLVRAHITEKAYDLSKRGVYTFEVAQNANKYVVAQAIKSVYGVTPKQVRIVKTKPRTVRSLMRAKSTHQSGMKKAYVYLKEGDTINYM